MERHHSHASDLKAELERVAEAETIPPNTILVRWEEELLLVDAWNTRGNKLRTVPSIIDEAITHFRIGEEVKEYRLAVHELVDERPALLYLGLSALRFVENGRVLELVKVQHPLKEAARDKIGSPNYVKSATDTWETAPLAEESRHQPCDLSTASSSEDGYHPASTLSDGRSRSGPFVRLKARRSSKGDERGISHSETPLHYRGIVRNQTDATLLDREGGSEGPPCVHIHPKYGPLFKHLQDQLPRHSNLGTSVEIERQTQDGNESIRSPETQDQLPPTATQADVTYDFRNRRVLPRPTLSRSNTPLADLSEEPSTKSTSFSPAMSRNPSYASNLSRRAGRGPRQRNTEDDDFWLSSDSSEKWKHVQLDPRRFARTLAPHRHRSSDHLGKTHSGESSVSSRPGPLPRSQSCTAFPQAKDAGNISTLSRS